MAPKLDPSDFVDIEYQDGRRNPAASAAEPAATGGAPPAPSREEVEAQVAGIQSELARLRQSQEQLERERAALEETRRRQAEWKTGRAEMERHLVRGLGLLEEAEFAARQEAEQMAKTINGLRDALQKIQAIQEESWTSDNFQIEMTRALTTLENARMEWNGARLKYPLLNATPPEAAASPEIKPAPATLASLAQLDFISLCRLGIAFTWPLVLAVLVLVAAILLRGK